ncbi:MAG TPA: hypothetical protein VGF94_14200 [Kofleriaceae bacterium]|jgi:hypothetical protein
MTRLAALLVLVSACAHAHVEDWTARASELCATIPTTTNPFRRAPALRDVEYTGRVEENETMNGTERFFWRVESPDPMRRVGLVLSDGAPIAMWIELADSVAHVCARLGWPVDDDGCTSVRSHALVSVFDVEHTTRLQCIRH